MRPGASTVTAPPRNSPGRRTSGSRLANALPARIGGRPAAWRPAVSRRSLLSLALWLFVLGNAAGILWIWGRGGADGVGYHWHSLTGALLGAGRAAALLAGYLALVEVLLLARLPFLERLVGFDRLTRWHRWNGHAVLDLVLAHVVFSVWGYARQDRRSLLHEYWGWLTLPQPAAGHPSAAAGAGSLSALASGSISTAPRALAAPVATSPYPGMITATIGTALLVAVAVSSAVIVRRRLSYEWWYAIHFTAYAAIALSWFHMIPAGNDLVLDRVAADYWRALFALSLALVVWFRVVRPFVRGRRLDLRVTEVVHEAPGVVSLRIAGRGLASLGAEAGQFFLWRFLAPGFWWTRHPFSLSEGPGGDSFRITAKALGDHTARLGEIPVGTRVLAEGPYGVFTARRRTGDRTLLVAGGIGITPVRALLEDIDGDVVVIYRASSPGELVFVEELDRLAAAGRLRIVYVVGERTDRDGNVLLSPDHLRELVPDVAERDVYLCGPPGLVDRVLSSLRLAGVPRSQTHLERFAF